MEFNDWLNVFGLKTLSEKDSSEEESDVTDANNNLISFIDPEKSKNTEGSRDISVAERVDNQMIAAVSDGVLEGNSENCALEGGGNELPKEEISEPGLNIEEIGEVTVSNNEELFECSICDKKYKLKSSLKRHINVHKTERLHCSFCSKTFFIKSALSQHEKTHVGTQYMCKWCGKHFASKLGCVRHERTHENKYSLYCEICGKGYNYKSDLTDHTATHFDNKTFHCEKCSKNFKARSSLARHKTVCGTKKHVKCDICGNMFKSYRYFKEHSKKHQKHADLHQCPDCGKVFSHHSSLYRHKKKTGHN